MNESKPRWEQILEEFWPSSDEDTTYTTLERELAERIAELEQQSSYYHSAVNDIALTLGWRLGQAYEIQSMLKKIEELKLHKRANLAKQGHVVPHDVAMQQVQTHINTTCNHVWCKDGFGFTWCFQCGIFSTEV